MKFTNINIGKRLAITFGITISLTLALSFISYQALSKLTSEWEQFKADSLEQFKEVAKGSNALGDGIHHSKNYLLRGQDYDQKFMADMEAIDEAAASYAGHGVMSENEKSILGKIKEDTEAYRAAIRKMTEMKTAGQPIEEIDKAIKGADRPLAAAFVELQKFALEQTNSTAQVITGIAIGSKWTIVLMSLLIVALSVLFAWLTTISITRPLREAVLAADAVAKGDLTQRIEVKSSDETGQLLQALQDMNVSLADIVTNVRSSTDSISTGARQVAAGNADLSQRTTEQASSLEETASSMEELTSTVKQNAENARQAKQLANNASDIAVKGGQAVSEVVETMASISTSSKKIVDIIGVIEGIAFQTNILALNAAVEAARAGEQGRGFAVVASEVRNLAQRSAAAAKEIKVLIGDSVSKVGIGAQQVDEAGLTMNEIVAAVKRVTDIMAEIAAASAEQSSGIEQINQAITQMDDVTQQNSALVEEASAAAEAMQDQAVGLSDAVRVFKLEAGDRGIRANAAKPVVHRASELSGEEKHLFGHPKERRMVAAKEDTDSDWKEF